VTDTDEGTPTFEGDIKPLFRERDHAAMLHVFDLWSFDDVSTNADAILAAVRGGSMPCDARWSQEKVSLFQHWVDGGTPGGETNDPLPG
jgi:hypothetical protein